MEGIAPPHPTPESSTPEACLIGELESPFAQEWVTISKQEYIERRSQASYWQVQHGRAKARIAELEQELAVKEAKIKDLPQRLFGKKSEKLDPAQRVLFENLYDEVQAKIEQQQPSKKKKVKTRKNAHHKGRRPLPADLHMS